MPVKRFFVHLKRNKNGEDMTTGTERAIAYIDLGILEENLRMIKSRITAGVKTLCVVKANAYGHGAVEVSQRLETTGVDHLGVATIDEGIELREKGIQLPILVMSGLFPWDEIGPLIKNELSLAIYDACMLKKIVDACPTFKKPLKVHVKVDTGMGRLGFSVNDMAFVGQQLKDAGNIVCEGLMSHFASSEIRDDYGLQQVASFQEARSTLASAGVTPAVAHMANSGAMIQYPEAHFDMVRVGISLYGSYPARALAEKLHLKQVMKFVTKIALIREFPPGQALSYGRTYTTGKTTRIAYIPVGYADGYPRSLSNKGFVLIKDIKCSIVGKVCMDWSLVDITDIDGVDVGEEVILLGRGNTQTITADEFAEHAGTIPYEILCKISTRVPRYYV
jgi:alanine racemase